MPVRVIIKPAIYREKRFSCACRAITISLKTLSRDRIFRRFGGFCEFVVQIAPVWHSLYRERRFSCACRAITISLKTPSRDRIFRRFGGFWRIRCKNRSRVALPLEMVNKGEKGYTVCQK